MGFSLRSYGFCWGVERAVAMAYEVGKTGKRGRLKVAFPFFWGLVFHGIFRVYPKRYIAFLVGFLKKFEVWREHIGVQIDRFRKRMWGLSSTFSKRCMVLVGFLWFGVVFFLPSFYCRDGDWDKWLSAVLLLSTAARWLSADTCLFYFFDGIWFEAILFESTSNGYPCQTSRTRYPPAGRPDISNCFEWRMTCFPKRIELMGAQWSLYLFNQGFIALPVLSSNDSLGCIHPSPGTNCSCAVSWWSCLVHMDDNPSFIGFSRRAGPVKKTVFFPDDF